MKNWIGCIALVFMVSGCGIYTKYQPAAEVPAHLYRTDSVSVADTASFGNLSWRDVFTDPSLQRLIDTALVRNTDLQTARLRVKEAEASLQTARLSYLPALFFSPEGAISSFDGGKAAKTYSVPVTASWELDIFGRVTNAKRRAKAALLQSEAYGQAVKTQLVAAVANQYYTLLMLDAQYAIAQSTETAWSESVRTARAMKQAGMMTEAGLAQTEATYYTVCTTRLDLKEQINQVENSLSLLLAEVPHAIERGTLAGQELPAEFSVGIPLQVLSARPDVRSAELALEQAFYTTNAARAAFYPNITLGGSAGWTNSAGDGLIVNPGKFLASAVASLTQPLFNKGANIAQLKIAKAQQEEARLAFEQTLLNAGGEVNNALVQYQTAREKAAFYSKQVASLETAARSTQLLMKHGNTTYLEVLTAQQSLLQAQLSQVANRFSEIQGLVTLYQALGGGRM
ncbi:MAG: TolC family protein [Parabacteroides sp.]|nr:TolC family protein [Parabacteroides sp.]